MKSHRYSTSPEHYDAIVVGARCAGAATALLTARAGLRVLVVDRAGYGSDTLSTHALMRGAVLQLHRWGLLDGVVASGAQPVRRTVFHYGDDRVVDVEVTPAHGVDALYAPRRRLLDRILVDAAAAAGAEVRHGVSVRELLRDPTGRVTGVRARDALTGDFEATAGLVVGADGRHSFVARQVGAPVTASGRHAGATVYGYFGDLDADGYQWHFAEGSAAAVIPSDGGVANVSVTTTPSRFRTEVRRDVEAGFHGLLAESFPAVAALVAAAPRVGGWRSFGGRPGHLRRAWGPGWALVGDAGSFKDPGTAHGITDALRDAETLAGAIVAVARGGDESAELDAYERERDELAVPILENADAVASLDWDLTTLQRLHVELSRLMKTEVAAITARDDVARAA